MFTACPVTVSNLTVFNFLKIRLDWYQGLPTIARGPVVRGSNNRKEKVRKNEASS